MRKFYCNKCKKDVDLINGKCPLCKTDWEKIIGESIKNIEDIDYDEDSNVMENDIESIFNFYLKIANIGKYLSLIVVAFILVVVATNMDRMDEPVLFLVEAIIVAVSIGLFGFMFEKNVKWKAYMLKINSEILKK